MLTASLCLTNTHSFIYLYSLFLLCVSDFQYNLMSDQCSPAILHLVKMYSLLLSVQKLNVPKMTHVASTWGDFYFVSCHSFWSFTSLTKNHVYANMEYKLTFSLYRLKNLLKVSSLYYFAFHTVQREIALKIDTVHT